MADSRCDICGGEGWVCENHLSLAWNDGEDGCQCGAGAPCVCNEQADLPEGFVVFADLNGNRLN